MESVNIRMVIYLIMGMLAGTGISSMVTWVPEHDQLIIHVDQVSSWLASVGGVGGFLATFNKSRKVPLDKR